MHCFLSYPPPGCLVALVKIHFPEEFGGLPRGQAMALGVAFLLAIGTGVFLAQKVFKSSHQSPHSAKGSIQPSTETTSAGAAGALDETFHRPEFAGQDIAKMALQPDGKILLCGYFDKVDGEWHNSIARLHADGTVDKTFNAKAGGSIHAVAVQPDGRIVIAGDFGSVNEKPRKTVARVNADGRLDETFNAGRGADKEARCLALQRDGKILLGGNFTRFNGAPHQRILRLNADGSIDSNFQARADESPMQIIVQPDGNILVAGSFAKANGAGRFGLTRLRPEGLTDRSFQRPALDACHAMALLPDGKILATSRKGPVVRLNADGSADSTFESGLVVDRRIDGLNADSRGRIIVTGGFTVFGDFGTRNMARLNSDGSLDKTFQCLHEFQAPILCAVVTAGDDVIVGGNFAERLLRFSGASK
jgi:uncharacterized delta-60 repeat protein